MWVALYVLVLSANAPVAAPEFAGIGLLVEDSSVLEPQRTGKSLGVPSGPGCRRAPARAHSVLAVGYVDPISRSPSAQRLPRCLSGIGYCYCSTTVRWYIVDCAALSSLVVFRKVSL